MAMYSFVYQDVRKKLLSYGSIIRKINVLVTYPNIIYKEENKNCTLYVLYKLFKEVFNMFR